MTRSPQVSPGLPRDTKPQVSRSPHHPKGGGEQRGEQLGRAHERRERGDLTTTSRPQPFQPLTCFAELRSAVVASAGVFCVLITTEPLVHPDGEAISSVQMNAHTAAAHPPSRRNWRLANRLARVTMRCPMGVAARLWMAERESEG